MFSPTFVFQSSMGKKLPQKSADKKFLVICYKLYIMSSPPTKFHEFGSVIWGVVQTKVGGTLLTANNFYKSQLKQCQCCAKLSCFGHMIYNNSLRFLVVYQVTWQLIFFQQHSVLENLTWYLYHIYQLNWHIWHCNNFRTWKQGSYCDTPFHSVQLYQVL